MYPCISLHPSITYLNCMTGSLELYNAKLPMQMFQNWKHYAAHRATVICCTCIRLEIKFILSCLILRHNDRGGVSNHLRLDCLLKRLFRRRSKKTSKKTSKLRVTGLCGGIHRWRWTLLTKSQWHGNCFHLMTSSWMRTIFRLLLFELKLLME